jgi:prenyltransferase beta subunit
MWVLSPAGHQRDSKRAAVILSLQQPSGVFAGDLFGETDTRFLYCAVNALSLLGRLSELDVDKTVAYIRKCRNFDGGFGSSIGAESHAAQGEHLIDLNRALLEAGWCSFCLRRGIGYFR